MSGDIKEITAAWKNDLTFETHGKSGHMLVVDGRSQAGAGPMELLLMSLAGCTGGDVIDILQKKHQVVTAFDMRVTGQRAEDHPRKYTAIEVVYTVTGQNIDPAAVARAIELSQTKYCSVSATLNGVAQITSRYEIREAESAPA